MYDLIVIGAGAAGVFTAIVASERGLKVLLLEKNPEIARKLMISGNGRCNISHYELDNREFLNAVKGNKAKYLLSAFSRFNVLDIMDFFEKEGLKLKIEKDGRIFPESDKAMDVINILLKVLKRNNVEIKYNAKVSEIVCDKEKNKIDYLLVNDKEKYFAKSYVLATGGKSYPGTGSTGDFYEWLENCGHQINDLAPALVPIIVKEKWVKELQGLSFYTVNFSIWGENKKLLEKQGDILFTHEGLSGPAIINISSELADLLKQSLLKIKINFFNKDFLEMDKFLLEELNKNPNKTIKNILLKYLPERLLYLIFDLAELYPFIEVHNLKKQDRHRLIHLLTEFTLNIERLDSFYKAMVTKGGVDLNEVDFKTMKSKKIKNLYLVGEILDLDAETGGYNLQLAWTTAYIAGSSVEK